ncbi:MAG: ATP-dependent zinc metalloprotease FtsH [Elusimicrobia bacterium]|nr:ATP-dependent zinc metalloprotease FtsH [Elusimicrobiota bacterium]
MRKTFSAALCASLLCPAPAFAQQLRAIAQARAPLAASPLPVAVLSVVIPLKSASALVPAQPMASAQMRALAGGLAAAKMPEAPALLKGAFDGAVSARGMETVAAASRRESLPFLAVASPRAARAPAPLLMSAAIYAGGVNASHAGSTMSSGLLLASLAAGVIGLMFVVRWIEGSKSFQYYLARRRWATATNRRWKDASPEEQAHVESVAERIVSINKAGRANSLKDVWLMIRGKHPSDRRSDEAPDEAADVSPQPPPPPASSSPARAKKGAPAAPAAVTFAHVAGQQEAKHELQKVVDFLKSPERYRRLGAKGFKGVLLFGPPGTGKTLIARAVAGEAGANFVDAKGSDFVNKYVGVGPSNIRAIFAKARGDGKKPGILFIDEIDAVGKRRGDGDGNQEYENTLNALLAEMSSEQNNNVVVMAATNRPELLDPALMRGRRFGLKVPVGLPDVEGREAILRVHTAGMPMAADLNLRRLAELTPRLSGADLEEIANDAAMIAADRAADVVSAEDFRKAVERQTLGHERKLVMSAEEKRVVSFHESGHALTAWLLPNSDTITKITIVPHGLQALGLVQTVSEEERFMYSRSWLLDRIAIALGGRVAEELATGETFSGAQNDFEQATRMARMMVMKFGMSAKVGHVSYDVDGERSGAGRAMSERQREVIDEEVRRIVEEQSVRVKALLAAHRAALDAMAGELSAKETLREADLARLLPPRPKS